MSESEPELFYNGRKVSADEMQRLMDASADFVEQAERDVMADYGVSDSTAAAIVYLRTRSRHTPAKEQELVDRDKAGNPIPLGEVLSGDF